jgi:hypothetical protein
VLGRSINRTALRPRLWCHRISLPRKLEVTGSTLEVTRHLKCLCFISLVMRRATDFLGPCVSPEFHPDLLPSDNTHILTQQYIYTAQEKIYTVMFSNFVVSLSSCFPRRQEFQVRKDTMHNMILSRSTALIFFVCGDAADVTTPQARWRLKNPPGGSRRNYATRTL